MSPFTVLHCELATTSTTISSSLPLKWDARNLGHRNEETRWEKGMWRTGCQIFSMCFLTIQPFDHLNFSVDDSGSSWTSRLCPPWPLGLNFFDDFPLSNHSFPATFQPNCGLLRQTDPRLVIHVLSFSIQGIICLRSVIFQKSHFTRLIINLSLSCFACRTNWDSNSKTKTTPGLVSMPQMQWRSQICQISYDWKVHFLRVENSDLELGSDCQPTESALKLETEVGTRLSPKF